MRIRAELFPIRATPIPIRARSGCPVKCRTEPIPIVGAVSRGCPVKGRTGMGSDQNRIDSDRIGKKSYRYGIGADRIVIGSDRDWIRSRLDRIGMGSDRDWIGSGSDEIGLRSIRSGFDLTQWLLSSAPVKSFVFS